MFSNMLSSSTLNPLKATKKARMISFCINVDVYFLVKASILKPCALFANIFVKINFC